MLHTGVRSNIAQAISFFALGCLLLAGLVSPVRAGGPPPFTEEDFRRQATFLQHMRDAQHSLRVGNRKRACTALRIAARTSGYRFEDVYIGLGEPGCGGDVGFTLPSWLLVAQAMLGDDEGALQSARNASNVHFTFRALLTIAEIQMGKAIAPNSFSYVKVERVPVGRTYWILGRMQYQEVRTPLDFSFLAANVPTRPDRAGARATLLSALPYALAVVRLAEHPENHDGPIPETVLTALYELAEAQAKAGDGSGLTQTLSRIPRDWEKVVAVCWPPTGQGAKAPLIQLHQARKKIAALRSPKERVFALLAIANRWERLQINGDDLVAEAEAGAVRIPEAEVAYQILSEIRNRRDENTLKVDLNTKCETLRRMQAVANRIPFPQKRAECLMSVASEQSLVGKVEESRKTLLLALRAANGIGTKFERANSLYQIADSQVEIGDFRGATGSFLAARKAANGITGATQRQALLSQIERSEQSARERQVAQQRRAGR